MHDEKPIFIRFPTLPLHPCSRSSRCAKSTALKKCVGTVHTHTNIRAVLHGWSEDIQPLSVMGTHVLLHPPSSIPRSLSVWRLLPHFAGFHWKSVSESEKELFRATRGHNDDPVPWLIMMTVTISQTGHTKGPFEIIREKIYRGREREINSLQNSSPLSLWQG